MMRLANDADVPLIWIKSETLYKLHAVFLSARAEKQALLQVLADWRAGNVKEVLGQAWPKILDEGERYIFLAHAMAKLAIALAIGCGGSVPGENAVDCGLITANGKLWEMN